MSANPALPGFTDYEVGDIYAEADLSGDALLRIRISKALGELAELAFTYKAASLGFGVARPLGDNEAFDVILNAGHRLWRVQVKSTYHLSKNGDYSFHALRAPVRGRRRNYTADSIDVLAAWVMPLDVWYIIPVQAFVPRGSLRVYPHREVSPAKAPFEAFREAWCLLACSEEGACDSRILMDGRPANENLGLAPGPDSLCPAKAALARLQFQPFIRRRGPSRPKGPRRRGDSRLRLYPAESMPGTPALCGVTLSLSAWLGGGSLRR
jgi:hypothetical protein